MAGRFGLTMMAVIGLAVAACGGSSATPTPAPVATDAPPAATQPAASAPAASAPAASAPAASAPAPVATGLTGASVEGVEWLLAEMSDGSEMNPLPPEVPVTMTLLDGVAAGTSGCNDYHGAYTINADEIVFGQIASTVKVCDDAAMIVESNYIQALSYVARFGVRDTGLLFVSPPGAALLAYAPKPTGSIVGDWTVTAYQNAQGAIVAPQDGVPLTTSFKADGTLTGNDGCNEFTGTYTIEGPRIVIAGLAGTRAACSSADLSDQETQFLAMLQASTIWTVSDTDLAFRGTNGIQTLTYAPAAKP